MKQVNFFLIGQKKIFFLFFCSRCFSYSMSYSKYQFSLQHCDPAALSQLELLPIATSTRKKDETVDGMLKIFGERFMCDPFNLSTTQAIMLINSLKELDWSRSTILQSFIPSYKRLYREHSGGPLGSEITQTLKECAKRVCLKTSKDFHPFILCDMFRLIRLTSKEYQEEPRAFSLLTLAMFSGLREGTLAELRLSNIENIMKCETTRFSLIVSLRVDKTKGGQAGPPITIVGNTKSIDWENMFDVCNPVYWLNAHLKEYFGFSLRSLFKKLRENPELRSTRIWGWKGPSMYQMFKKFIARVGYDPEQFCFHSLRKGLMSNRIILEKTTQPASVLDLCSMIGGWSLSSKHRQRYITDSLSRVYISNKFGEGVTTSEMLTVNGFHRTKFKDVEANTPMIKKPSDKD